MESSWRWEHGFVILIALSQVGMLTVKCSPAVPDTSSIDIVGSEEKLQSLNSTDENSIGDNDKPSSPEETVTLTPNVTIVDDGPVLESNSSDPKRPETNSTDTIEEVLKALNLPANFAEPLVIPLLNSSQGDKLQSLEYLLDENPLIRKNNNSSQNITDSILELMAKTANSLPPGFFSTSSSSPDIAASSSSSSSHSHNRTTRDQHYGTGNSILDKIMNCPCEPDKLTKIGIKPLAVAFSNYPDPGIYRYPPYGPENENKGPGDVIASDLLNLGGNSGSVLGQILRIYFMVPVWELTIVKPLVVGLIDAVAQAIEAAGDIVGGVSKSVPGAIRSAAIALKKGLILVSDLIAILLHLVTTIVKGVGAGATSFSGTVPLIFDQLVEMAGATSTQITGAIDLISGIAETATEGFINAGKAGGNLFGGLVEGKYNFGGGVLNGVKYGINGEDLPPAYGGGQW